MNNPTERGLFERISDHVPLPNWPEVEDICEEFEQELEELKEGDQLLTEIANILDDVGYKGSYADGVQLLKQQLADITADRDSWRAQCSERVKDWEEVRQQLAAAREAVEGLRAKLIALRPQLIEVYDFINEPQRLPDPEPMDVRDYRHQLYRKWEKLANALAELTAPLPEKNG